MLSHLHPARGQRRTKPSSFKPVLEELEARRLPTIGSPVAAIAESSNVSGQVANIITSGSTSPHTFRPEVSNPSSANAPKTSPAPTPPPPSLFQAVVALYLDGAYLETSNLLNKYISNPANYDSPSATANDTAAAAAAGINLNAVQSLYSFLGATQTDLNLGDNSYSNYRSLWATKDLQFNWQYGGAYAPYAVMAGAQEALQAVQQ